MKVGKRMKDEGRRMKDGIRSEIMKEVIAFCFHPSSFCLHPCALFDIPPAADTLSRRMARQTPVNSISSSPPLVALAGWIVPGAGYVLLGHRARGITIGITVIALFLAGLLIGGIKVIDPPEFPTNANVVSQVLQKPWFIGQVLNGPMGIATAYLGKTMRVTFPDPDHSEITQTTLLPSSHARSWEVGTLYTAVAGMLNLLAIIDSSYRAGESGTAHEAQG
jgi:hypothetical protein